MHPTIAYNVLYGNTPVRYSYHSVFVLSKRLLRDARLIPAKLRKLSKA